MIIKNTHITVQYREVFPQTNKIRELLFITKILQDSTF